MVVGSAVAAVCFVLANPYALLSFDEFWSDVRRQEEAASGFGKLGLDYDSGLLYYLWVLTWGLGWVPLAAAVAGAVRAFTEDVRRALFLVPWPLVFIVYMGTQERFFGRWLLPAFPAIALLAGLAVVRAVDALGPRPRARVALGATLVTALLAQGLFYSVHSDRVLSRDDTRNLARAWMVENIAPGSKVVVEPIVPDAWFADPDVHDARDGPRPRAHPLGPALDQVPDRPHDDRRAGPHDSRRQGALRQHRGLRAHAAAGAGRVLCARRILLGGLGLDAVRARDRGSGRGPERARLLPRRWRATPTSRRSSIPTATATGPAVPFNFDWSFNHYPRAYERPGPTVVIQRLRAGRCGDEGS